ncbi:MAG: tRNA pseudouridine(38-40) synthase TruA [Duncaniella sp.]|nr:tRNA pseudouridine(38-40) synthase TruA [Duncaniella sp.]
MRLSYRGEPYHGWQCQPGAVTVQEVIETALSKVLRRPMKITGAGRTDAGVNARMMIAHFDVDSPIADPVRLVGSINALVGRDIAIQEIYRVPDDLHARFDATSRTYHYYAVGEKSPFFYPLSWKAPAGLDYDAMNRAARLLLTTSDFTSFAKLHTDAKTNICRVTHAQWHRIDTLGGEGWVFVITADRFLRNMVRAVVGTLVEVGRGKISVEDFGRIIERKDRCAAGTSMPAQALYLWDVTYPDISVSENQL